MTAIESVLSASHPFGPDKRAFIAKHPAAAQKTNLAAIGP
jgi:hypothetical protein